MANTYTQIYIQIVFAVQSRQNLIRKNNKDELYKYTTGIIRNKGHKLIVINGMSDHIHIFIGMKPKESISDLVRDIKKDSSNFINSKRWFRGKFNWQETYGAFSYGHSQMNDVVQYIQRQEEHHAKKTFKEEYLGLLRVFNIKYDEQYVFDWIENVGG
ncbi:MAG: IS200/IS605 family transposase [Candidatus Marinimicrobia bacterium]|nr:IS200/IS605 family transposase [Candidatus Neomarinimicrobiota bacterium]